MAPDPRYFTHPKDQMFTHEDCDDAKTQRSWNVSAIMRVMLDMFEQGEIEPVLVPMDAHFAEYCRHHRGVEPHRLNRLTPEALRTPILMLQLPDDTYLLMDGTHRYVYAQSIGRAEILCFIVPQEVADKARIYIPKLEDFEAYKQSFSGIL